ncbi:MAG: hypothetical protein GY705_17575 [Bacteroidetes bacterium]|nr:hypothetical protein [Bacteroidota bacterium]
MRLSDKANLIIYRFREKGLEVFLVNSNKEGKEEDWKIPQGKLDDNKPRVLLEEDKMIELDPVHQEDGQVEQAYAVEGDWHDIPSLKSMLYEDVMYVKGKVKKMEKGTYFAVKEAFKKVLPHQYEFLKELKDILIDRNSVKDL